MTSYFNAEITLKASDVELVNKFKKMKNFDDVCETLEVTQKHLHYILFDQKNKYSSFSIPKKNGGIRNIAAPRNNLKILQQKLTYIISLIYKPTHNIHGYVKERNIVSNAKRHLNKNFVLNFDLHDFFNSINLGRIRGLLQNFFKIGSNAATVIANICCYNNTLPQGAPTSPILSNMICFLLDKQMQQLAKQHSCIYTRYADDLTFSTVSDYFPRKIAYQKDDTTILGDRVIQIVENNGFKINPSKTRLTKKTQHMEVTGVTVNERLNVKRNYIKKIRAILRSLEINNLDESQKIFESKYQFRKSKRTEVPHISNVLKGMINYVGMVKGFDDLIFKKLALRYNKVVGHDSFHINNTDFTSMWESNVWVVEVGMEDETGFYCEDQGTGFFLKDVGFVTNSHVVRKFDGEIFNSIQVHKSRYSKEKRTATILIDDKDRDIAILKVDEYNNNVGFDYNFSHDIGQNILLIGYPNHGDGNSQYRYSGQIVQHRTHFMPDKFNEKTKEMGVKQERTVISSRIVIGNSGGPVVNMQNEVIGIATQGFNHLSPTTKDDSTADNIIVRIQDVFELLAEEKEKSFTRH